MHTGRAFRPLEVLAWTRRDILSQAVIAASAAGAHAGGLTGLAVPWGVVGVLGTATSFLVGFMNNASYGRAWEARTVWGGIVNDSRAFALALRDLPVAGEVTDEELAEVRRRVLRRHVAWLTALRHQLREPRPWESTHAPENREFQQRWYTVDEWGADVVERLEPDLPPDELEAVRGGGNRALRILGFHSAEIAALARRGALDGPSLHVALERLNSLVDQQGRCERIKNYPYPRQFATANGWVMKAFVLCVPFALVPEVAKLTTPWLAVPVSVVVTWIFSTLVKIGEVTANPFEGSANDVPITAMARGIEIDLCHLYGEAEVPAPLVATNDILT